MEYESQPYETLRLELDKPVTVAYDRTQAHVSGTETPGTVKGTILNQHGLDL